MATSQTHLFIRDDKLTALPSLKQYVTLGWRSGILRDGEILLGNMSLLMHETQNQRSKGRIRNNREQQSNLHWFITVVKWSDCLINWKTEAWSVARELGAPRWSQNKPKNWGMIKGKKTKGKTSLLHIIRLHFWQIYFYNPSLSKCLSPHRQPSGKKKTILGWCQRRTCTSCCQSFFHQHLPQGLLSDWGAQDKGTLSSVCLMHFPSSVREIKLERTWDD